MSIIEKAVGKLDGKPKIIGGSERTPESREAGGPGTVQKVTDPVISPQPDATASTANSAQPEVTVGDRAEEPRAPAATGIVDIPFDDLQEMGFLSPSVPRSKVAEEFRTIKRPLLKNIAGTGASAIQNANLIMVTSALQGDGKTFSAINLALSIAMEQDKTVLFVDADVSRANAGTLFNVPANSPGLTDVLENKGVGLGDVIMRTSLNKFSFLPAGKLHERSNELLASESMTRLMSELSQRYLDRVIVFDSPPLLLTTEASVLAGLMGQIVFVARADVTPQTAITESLQYISEDKMVGMVLNGARQHLFSSYGYGYGYSYSYGDRYSKSEY